MVSNEESQIHQLQPVIQQVTSPKTTNPRVADEKTNKKRKYDAIESRKRKNNFSSKEKSFQNKGIKKRKKNLDYSKCNKKNKKPNEFASNDNEPKKTSVDIDARLNHIKNMIDILNDQKSSHLIKFEEIKGNLIYIT